MKYQVSFLTERVQFVIDELKDNITVLEEDGNYTRVEIEITDSLQLLNLFHAGVMAGTRPIPV